MSALCFGFGYGDFEVPILVFGKLTTVYLDAPNKADCVHELLTRLSKKPHLGSIPGEGRQRGGI
jgi:hypothetical protein